jgi:hypothetical protein
MKHGFGTSFWELIRDRSVSGKHEYSGPKGSGVGLSPVGTAATSGLLYKP